jgi:hypothetical protein
MASTTPKSQLILGYRDLFGEDPPEDRIAMIRGLCKDTLIGEIARLNYMLKPKENIHQDTSLETQREELFYMCGEITALHQKYLNLLKPFRSSNSDYPILFTRQACLFAAEEIINSDLVPIAGFTMQHSWEALLKYYLAVSSTITDMRTKGEKGDLELEGAAVAQPTETDESGEVFETVSPFEEINAKIIVLNELSLSSEPFYIAYRGYRLLEFLTSREDIGIYTKEHIAGSYNMEYPQFIYELLSMYIANNKGKENNIRTPFRDRELDASFLFFPAPGSEQMFITLSQVIQNPKPITLLSIRKYPFYKASIGYILVDNIFLIEKCYSQFLNDFWFDKIKGVVDDKGTKPYDIRRYRGIIGAFLENYFDNIIRYCFAKSVYFHVRTFNELKVLVDRKNKELLDVYIRFSDKVFLAEVKSTGIYDNEKYSGSLDAFYKNDRTGFFNSFGMGQLIEAISLLDAQAKKFDAGFPERGSIKLYPAIIVNEKALQTPLMAEVFYDRFQELFPAGLNSRIKVQALSIIHLSDWENMEDHIHEDPFDFFRVLKFHVRNKQFMPPFYNTLILKDIKAKHRKTMKIFEEIIDKYQRPGQE